MFFILVLFALYVLAISLSKGLNLHLNRSYGSDLEAYINSKRPQNTAEVERLTKEYESSTIWARGL
jgi:hypothetical protein